jgi:hypothetical protein
MENQVPCRAQGQAQAQLDEKLVLACTGVRGLQLDVPGSVVAGAAPRLYQLGGWLGVLRN